MKEVTTLKDLMIYHLQSLYDAETKWANAQKELIPQLKSTELKKLFEKGSRSADMHAEKLKKVLVELDETTLARKNIVVTELIKEMKDLHETAADPEVLDAGMIVTHQCMNHYLMAKYGTMASYARLLLHEDIAGIVHKILEEQKTEDKELTSLAEGKINVKAKATLIL